MNKVKSIATSILIFLVTLTGITSYGQSWVWAKSSGCNNSWGNELGMIAYDGYSDMPGLYAIGDNMGDSVCVPPFVIHNTADSIQLFIIKYDTSGRILWTIESQNGQCGPMNYTTDTLGNLFVLGVLYTDSVWFGSHLLTNPNYIPGGWLYKNHCYFFMKIDPYGNIQWSKCGGNIAERGEMLIRGGIALDAQQNIYISGTFDDSILNIDGHIFTNVHADSGDIFLIKYDTGRNYVWGKTFGGVGDEHGQRMLIGKNNRIYQTGWFNSPTVSFGSITLTLTGTNFGLIRNIFLTEYDTDGNVIWSRNPRGSAYNLAFTIDTHDNLYLGGGVYDTSISFGTHSYSHPDLWWGAFLVKYDTSGADLWVNYLYPLTHTTSGGIRNRFYEIAVDPCDNVWATGELMRDSIGMNGTTLFSTRSSGSDPFIFVGFNSSGALLQASYYNSGGDDNAGIVSDCLGNIYVAGDVRESTRMGAFTLRNYTGAENMFVAKYNTGLGCSGICPISGSLGVKEQGTQNTISIFPNPASTTLTVQISDNNLATTMEILDITGRVCGKHTITAATATISVANLTPGLYVYKFRTTGNIVTGKLIIER